MSAPGNACADAPGDAPGDATAVAAAVDVAVRHRRVLVIDDNAVDLMLYRRIMKRSGHFDEVHTFAYAAEALEWLEDHAGEAVHAILLDVNMPRMNGFEFLAAATERLGERFDTCVVIMLTTSLDPEDVERARSFDAVRGYVNKPLTLETLERIVALVDAHCEARAAGVPETALGALPDGPPAA